LVALLELLDDESTAVSHAVRLALVAAGREAVPVLLRATKSARPRLRLRARALLLGLGRRRVLRRLIRHASRREIDLERALFLLGGLDRPPLDSRPYVRALDAMGAEVKRRVAAEEDALGRATVLCRFLGDELGYVGAEVEYDHPDHVHLHRAIERKRGMPLTLTAIYLFVARRAGLRAAPLALPGHVMLRLYAGERSLIVDPFHGGRIRSRSDVLNYISQRGLVPRPEWFRDAPDWLLFQRHASNLMNSFSRRGLESEAKLLHRVAQVVARVHGRRVHATA
jgi:regulator of sirC expression with transglutaminase-like and TPR domain